jgi:hypothetical protein
MGRQRHFRQIRSFRRRTIRRSEQAFLLLPPLSWTNSSYCHLCKFLTAKMVICFHVLNQSKWQPSCLLNQRMKMSTIKNRNINARRRNKFRIIFWMDNKSEIARLMERKAELEVSNSFFFSGFQKNRKPFFSLIYFQLYHLGVVELRKYPFQPCRSIKLSIRPDAMMLRVIIWIHLNRSSNHAGP